MVNKITDLFYTAKKTLNRLIVSRYELSIEELGRRKIFTVFILLLILPLVIFGATHVKNGLYVFGIMDWIFAMVFFGFIILLSYKEEGKYLYRLTTVLLGTLLIYWIQAGAIEGYASIWALAFPLFAFFLMGKKEGFFWTSICLFLTALIFINPFSMLTHYAYPAQFISRHLFIFAVIFLFTYNYESVREKYKSAMKAEQDQLLLEKEKLAEAKEEAERANASLKEEMRVREQAEMELRRHHDHLEEMVAERTLEIKRNSIQLEANEKRYRLMADNVNDLIWTTDMDNKFTFISPSVSRLYGYTVDEAMSLPSSKWNTPESRRRLVEAFTHELDLEEKGTAENKTIILQLEHLRKDGSLFPVEIKASFIRDENGKAVGVVGVTRDISDRIAIEQEREKIKEQLAQSQKLEALGTLVSGLAHDFNNFLGGIIGSFDLLSHLLKKETLNKKEAIEKYLTLGIESSKRSAGLINQLLILSKKHEIRLSPIDIKSSLNRIYELCRNSFPKSIEIDFKSDDDPLIIMGDMVQIEQVLLNLCINASHAMTIMRQAGDKQGGKLTVRAERITSDYMMKKNYPESAGIVDFWVRIKISDTGVGIDDAVKQRIFEPFFSTKNKNESSGLGLAISYNIIKKHGGIIHVDSQPGSGSCFSLYFPVYTNGKNVHPVNAEQDIVHASGTILVIDDEKVILNIAEGFLIQCGYTVLTAEGAEQGIEIFKNKHSEISAVLVDLSMPGKSGLEVFLDLKKIDNDVKVILSSGMLDNESREAALKMGVRDTMNKPYMAAELSMKMGKIVTGQ